jgi:hypothetical protein
MKKRQVGEVRETCKMRSATLCYHESSISPEDAYVI